MEYVTEQTGGKVTFEPYYAGSLFPVTETLQQVGNGVADVGMFSTSYSPDDLILANLLNQAGGSQNDASFPLGYFQGLVATQDFALHNELLQQEFHDNGVQLLSLVGSLNYNILCIEEISSLEQAQGIRTRVGGGTWGAEVESLGMVQTFIQGTELYDALQRRVIDCVSLQAPSYVDLGLWEVAKHFTPVLLSTFPGNARVVNLDVWNSFPDELKQTFFDGVAYEQSRWMVENLDSIARFVVDGPADFDLQFHDAIELNDVVAAFQQEIKEELSAQEFAGGSITGADFIAEYEEYMEKWRAHFAELGLPSGDPARTIITDAADVAAAPDETWGAPVREAFLSLSEGLYG